jgi:beta-glucosidase
MNSFRMLPFFLTLSFSSALAQPYSETERKVERLLAEMTLEEKVGQMTQLTLQAVSSQRGTSEQPHALDREKLEEALLHHHVGSLLNVWDIAFSVDEWQELITTIQDVVLEKSRLKIPVIYGVDSVHGANYTREATLFPQNIAMAATWNPDLVREAARITALETRASGIPWNFSPVLDLGRQPLWSRFFETFGEDVHLASQLGVAAVAGYQGEDVSSGVRVAATLKHFLGYGQPVSGRDRTPAWIPKRFLYEHFVPPFQAAIEAGAQTIMINSGEINGIPVHASHEILTVLLREELGFQGVAVTDWEDILKLVTIHRVAHDEKEAIYQAVKAGIDMSMAPYSPSFAAVLADLVREGRISESRIDESVRRILKLKFDLGLFDNPYPDPELKDQVGPAEARAVSRGAAEEAVTLLKNDGSLLPLSESARILVTGPAARSLPAIYGSWTYTWQGTDPQAYPDDAEDLLTALRERFGESRTTYLEGATWTEAVNLDEVRRAAADHDAVIVCAGEPASTEKPGDIVDLTMSKAQLDLIRAAAEGGKPVILVLAQNRPRIIEPVAELASAIVNLYQTGPYAGRALAGVLTGDVNPSGRLPFTYPRYTGGIVLYDRKYSEDEDATPEVRGYDPQFEFGHGLSYTTFEYSNLTLNRTEISVGDSIQVAVTVRNAGERRGKEVVQLYLSDLVASVTPSVKRLKGFSKVSLNPGESATVRFMIGPAEMSFIGRDNVPVVEPGEFRVQVGGLEASFFAR